jgi:hypothetical protein
VSADPAVTVRDGWAGGCAYDTADDSTRSWRSAILPGSVKLQSRSTLRQIGAPATVTLLPILTFTNPHRNE